MSKENVSPVALSERIEVLDVLRGFAVCGILFGNLQWFSGYGMMPPGVADQASMADKAVHFLIHLVIEGKFYSIFSFLFGVGFAIHLAKAEERGDTKVSLFKRRLFWLLVIGLLHAWLLWAGDILSIYAGMGFLLLLFRRKPDQSLLKWATWLMIIPILTYVLLFAAFTAFAPADAANGFQAAQMGIWNTSVEQVRGSSFFEIATGFNVNYVIGRYMGLIFQMRLPKILAMFLLGLYAYRKGLFSGASENRPLIQNVMIYGLAGGLVANILMSTLAGNEASFPPSLAGLGGVIAYAFGVPALALGTAAAIFTSWHGTTFRPILKVFAPAGKMALTNYLMQTAICVTIFYGYGFGRFGSMHAVEASAIGLAIIALQLIFSAVWFSVFAYGPVEWIWRQLTYRRRLPLRRSPARSVPATPIAN